MMSNEPKLEDIEDYNTLKGEKRKVVFAVIAAGLIMGAMYAYIYNSDKADDKLEVEKSFKYIPMK